MNDAVLKAYQSKKDLPGSIINIISTEMAPLDEPSLNIVHTSWLSVKLEPTFGYNIFGNKVEL